jgi:hypothetical protein
MEFFEKKIRPVLVQHCYECHGSKLKKPKGGLVLDNREGLRRGGRSGPAVVPGRPQESLLLQAISHTDKQLKMPRNGKLPAAVVADFRRWIEMGAPDPRDKAGLVAGTVSWEQALKVRRQWWSLQPVKKPEPPVVEDRAWATSPVDRFILAGLEKAGLSPGAAADRRTLIRRLSLLLTGLPPSPEETEAFTKDPSPDAAYARLVDRLLASPHFGERWARHWMDLVRYSETHGFEWNYEVHHAWRYRDYLIRALNADVAYDQLVREHIAGDLLPPGQRRLARDAGGEFNESIIGTAFWRFGEVGHDDCIEFREIGLDAVDNQIDTLTKAFQATTVACARCHDHKLDAVSMKDYYALFGMLQSSRQVSHSIDIGDPNAALAAQLTRLHAKIKEELASLWLGEARTLGSYLVAAQAACDGSPDAAKRAEGLDAARLAKWNPLVKNTKPALEDLLHPWIATRGVDKKTASWTELAKRYEKESRERREFNTKSFQRFGETTVQSGKPGLALGA